MTRKCYEHTKNYVSRKGIEEKKTMFVILPHCLNRIQIQPKRKTRTALSLIGHMRRLQMVLRSAVSV